MAFATHADLGIRLGVDLTSGEQDDATALIALAQELIQSETGQDIELVEDDVLTRPGTWSDRLRLPQRPVVAVSSVTIDGTAVDADTYYVDGDELVRKTGLSTDDAFLTHGRGWGGPESVLVVTYDHGLSTIPGVVKAVCLEMCVRVWVNPGTVQAETYGSENVAYGDYRSRTGLLLTDVERESLNRVIRRAAGSVKLR